MEYCVVSEKSHIKTERGPFSKTKRLAIFDKITTTGVQNFGRRFNAFLGIFCPVLGDRKFRMPYMLLARD